jgi:peptide/nickel transport system substrate-binding protein
VTANRYPLRVLDPHQTGSVPVKLWNAAGNGLLNILPPDEEGSPYRLETELATALPEMPAPDTFIFSIRNDVKWHDGTDLTPADVKFSLEHMQTSPLSPISSVMKFVESIEVTGNQVVIKLGEPFAGLLPYFGSEWSTIVPEHVYSEEGAFDTKIIGSGPFLMEDEGELENFTLQRNPNYWRSGFPYLESIDLSIVPDDTIMLASFIDQQTDIYMHGFETPKSIIDQIPDSLNATIYRSLNSLAPVYLINHNRPPFDNPDVRRAISLGVDRQQINASTAAGEGFLNGPIPTYMSDYALSQDFLSQAPGYRTPKEEDIVEARRLLDAAGATGTEFEVLGYQPSVIGEPFATVMEQFMGNIGLSPRITVLAGSDARERRTNADFDVAVTSRQHDFDPEGYLSEYLPGNFGNWSRVDDPQLTRMITAQRGLTDVDERRKAVEDIQKYLLDMNYRVHTLDGYNYGASQEWIKDYWQISVGVSNMEDVWVDRG